MMRLSPSDEERAAVATLRGRDRVSGSARGTRWLEDHEMLRFVRARKTLDESEDLFVEAMEWRATTAADPEWPEDDESRSFGVTYERYVNAIDAAERRGAKPAERACPAWFHFACKYNPSALYGCDANGLPILYTAMGRADLQGMVKAIGFDNLMRHSIWQARDREREREHACGSRARAREHTNALASARSRNGPSFSRAPLALSRALGYRTTTSSSSCAGATTRCATRTARPCSTAATSSSTSTGSASATKARSASSTRSGARARVGRALSRARARLV